MERTLVAEVANKVNKTILLKGWIDTRRDHGKLVFLDLRDRSGIVQLVVNPQVSEEAHLLAEKLSNEDVVSVQGLVQKRPEDLVNPEMLTGTVEVAVEEIQVLGKVEGELPIPVSGAGLEIEEEKRLRYRYLDLRRPRMQENIRVRSKLVQLARGFLIGRDFIEIETPILTKSTPEGSRDFIVPSRLQQGKFYALPQSPQQYKQLLMAAGFERYFQIARAIRDEDLRADRGFEHTQIDLELSFVTQRDVMRLVEQMVVHIMEKLGLALTQKPFPIFTYEQALGKFGADKFDLRTESEIKQNALAFAWVIDFPFFEEDDEGGWTFTHNPFSMPQEDQIEPFLAGEIDVSEVKTQQYDLVCNGYEVGGGSIRSHCADVLRKVFQTIGYQDDEIDKQFGHMLEAFRYGAPPHGGIALGVERLTMVARNEKSLKETVAFPMTGGGKTAVMDAPAEVLPEQLDELGIKIVRKNGDEDTTSA